MKSTFEIILSVLLLCTIFLVDAKAVFIPGDGVEIAHFHGDSLTNNTLGFVLHPDISYPGMNVNHAIAGISTYGYLAQCNPVCPWATGDSDDIHFFLMGHNDFSVGGNETDYEANVLAIMDAVEAATGAAEWFIIPSPYSHDATIGGTFFDRSGQREWQDIMAEVDASICATDVRAVCEVDLRGVLQSSLHYIWDKVHPNEAGQELIAQTTIVPEPSYGVMMVSGCLFLAYVGRHRQKR